MVNWPLPKFISRIECDRFQDEQAFIWTFRSRIEMWWVSGLTKLSSEPVICELWPYSAILGHYPSGRCGHTSELLYSTRMPKVTGSCCSGGPPLTFAMEPVTVLIIAATLTTQSSLLRSPQTHYYMIYLIMLVLVY